MDLRKLKTLIDLVSESGISELEVTEGEGKVRIVKNAPPVYVQPAATPKVVKIVRHAPTRTAPPVRRVVVIAPASRENNEDGVSDGEAD